MRGIFGVLTAVMAGVVVAWRLGRTGLAEEKVNKRDVTPEPEPMAGPGSVLDEAVERQTGLQPGETAPGLEHAAPGGRTAEEEHHPSHFSHWPIVVALSLAAIGIGFLSHWIVMAIGTLLLLVAVIGWLWEPWVS